MSYKRISTVQEPRALGALLTAVCVLMLLTVVAGTVWAQAGRGIIQGFITDSSGARVPGAQIQIIQIETNSTFDLQTNAEGLYIAQNLPIGNYRVVVKKQGFENFVREPILVRAGVVTQMDLAIRPGGSTETVTITAEAPILDVSTTSSPTSVRADTVEVLPIISGGAKRNISQLLVNLPGLTSYDANNRESATWSPRVNGAAGGQTESFIDGGPGSGISTGKGALEEVGPSIEMVGEFSVVSNAFNAEYGGFGSWFTSVQIKSGANALHGSVYNHYVNNALNARSFFQKQVTAGNQNEGGFTLGGPVVLPKIYNGRNKTFFFVSEGLYFTRNGPSLDPRTIPMAAFKTGDFSGYLSGTSQIPIFDPASTAPDGKGSFVRTQFPENKIPANRINSAAKKIVAFMPDPDIPGALTQNFYSRAFSGKFWPYFNNYVTTAKVDHNISTKQKLSVTYTNQVRHRQLQGENVGWFLRIPWGSVQENPLDYINFQSANSWRVRVNHDYIVSPAVLNHVTVSVDRYINLGHNATAGGGWNQKLGLGAGMPVDNGSFPAISFSGGTASPMGLGRGYDNVSFETRSRIDESLSWIRGRHSLKFGFSYTRVAVNGVNLGSAAGSYSFSNAQTSQPNAGSTNLGRWGSSFASFLLGAVSSASVTMTDMIGTRSQSTAFFAQDEWHATSKLTLSYGLRWDYTPPTYEVNNRQSSMDPTLKNPSAGNLLGALAFAVNHGPFQTPWKKGFGPRLGMAYQLGSKTVLRASGGIYYATGGFGVSTTGYTSSPSFRAGDAFSPVYYWGTGSFPQNFLRPPILDPSFSNGQSASILAPDGARLPQITSWTFGIQRALGNRASVDVSYIGSHSTHMSQSWALNTLDIQYVSLQNLLSKPITDAAAKAAGYTAPFPGFENQTGNNTVAASLRRYPQYSSASLGSAPTGQSSMHSLQIKGDKRLASGMSLLGYFTWMKVLSKGFGQYPLGPQEWQLDGSSVPAVFGLTWTYELPFGRGRKFANWDNPVAQRLVSGWAVNGFVRYQSGTPLGVSGPNSTLSLLGYSKRANYIDGTPATLVTNPRDFEPSKDRYLNVAAFASSPDWEFGTLPASLDWLRGFSSKTESVQVGKDTRISERVGLMLMFDLQNPFNFHHWTNPSANLSSPSTFGQVTGSGAGRAVQINATVSF